jgi:GNAT superfamily N-acetyltransferase
VTITLRDGCIADIFRLQEIERAAAELFRGSGLIDVDAMSVTATSDHIAAIEQDISLVAEADGRIAGFVIGEMHGDVAYLRELDVDPSVQQRGIGAQLVQAFTARARADGARATYLSTFRDPPWNAPFYRKLGFTDVARADYLPWMTELEASQATFLDLSTRVFLKLC